jgi:nicotinate-nucleotide adenylyltransferase
LVDARHRFEMTRLAVIPYEKFTVSDVELTRNGVIYTADTLKMLHKQYPDSDLFFIIGEDSLFELENWMRPLEVLAQCSFVVCMRHHHNVSDHPYVQKMRSLGAVFHFLSLSPQNISASDIRRQISLGVLNDTLLTPEVCEYIRVMDLYGCTASPKGAVQAYEKLKEDLNADRLLHSMAVAYTANRLAQIYQLDVKKCELAALLHDCAKCMDLEKLQQIACDAKLTLSDTEFHSAGLLHGPVSAVIAETRYGIHDINILTAIATHTTGYAGMNKVDMVIFLADKIEPYRENFHALKEIRVLADQDLYKATYFMMRNTMEHVTNLNKPLHPETKKTMLWILDHIN